MFNKGILHQSIALIPVNLVELLMGVGFGWTAPILHLIGENFTVEQRSWIGSLHYAGRTVGPVLGILLLDRIGRNFIFIIAASMCFGCWVVLTIAAPETVIVHYFIRILYGIATGLHDQTMGVYLGENCSPGYRGIFNAVTVIYFILGEVISYVLVSYISYFHTNLILSAMGFLTLISMYLLKEPAYFLIMKGRLEEAEKNFVWLQGCSKNEDNMNEFQEMKEYVLLQQQQRKESLLQMISTPEARKSLRIVIVFTFLIMATGFGALNSYITIAFGNVSFLPADKLTIICGILQLITTIAVSPTIEYFNRRTLFLTSGVFISVSMTLTGILFIITKNEESTYLSILKFSTLSIYTSCFSAIVFPLSSALRGELLPQKVKALGSGLALIFGSIGAFVTARIYLPICEIFGIQMNFFMYAIIGLIITVYVYLDIPETRGKTLVQIQKELNKNSAPCKTITDFKI